MIDKNKIINLTNREHGSITYRIPDLNIRRTFSSGETKQVTFNEIEQLSWVEGGKAMLKHYLVIQDPEAAEEILGAVEPEYYYTKKEIDKLLKEGSIAQLEDAIEFGPRGVIDLIKKEAVDLKLNDVRKREVIFKNTKFNVDNAIRLEEESKKEEAEAPAETGRRSVPITVEPAAPARRTEPIVVEKKYKIVGE